MLEYHIQAREEMRRWKKSMQRRPTLLNRISKNVQSKINSIIPEKAHRVITGAIKHMTRAVVFGAEFVAKKPLLNVDFEIREAAVRKRITFFSRTAAAEGAITGAGGILLGLADFPLWLSLKMKMLFEIATIYGYDVKKYTERIYILLIFELTFSSQRHRNEIFSKLNHWDNYVESLPADIDDFDWRNFQQEYRDYIDIAKLLQLVPGIGAPVGAIVNHRLTEKLGMFAMNCYRLRMEQQKKSPGQRPDD